MRIETLHVDVPGRSVSTTKGNTSFIIVSPSARGLLTKLDKRETRDEDRLTSEEVLFFLSERRGVVLRRSRNSSGDLDALYTGEGVNMFRTGERLKQRGGVDKLIAGVEGGVFDIPLAGDFGACLVDEFCVI